MNKNNFRSAVLGLSGGIDSALTLAIAVDAIGAENVMAVMLPSRYTAAISIDDAGQQTKMLGVKLENIAIESLYMAATNLLKPLFNCSPIDKPGQNIQARSRAILLMAISNHYEKLLLTTGNKSELAVGYATLYGDMAGGFCILKDVYKTMVYRLATWRNRQSQVIPKRILTRPPTAELCDNQRDTDTLPPYEILDPILESFIERDLSPEQIIAAGFEHDIVHQVIHMVTAAEHKRRQAAPGVRITARAFGKDRRYPITAKFFTPKFDK